MTKLTLSVDEAVVEKAKAIAEARGTSVSAIFSQFVKAMATESTDPLNIGPVTQTLTGIINMPAGKNHKDLLADALADKYGRRK